VFRSRIFARTNVPGSKTEAGLAKIARKLTEPLAGSTVMSVKLQRAGSEYCVPSAWSSVTFA
jgi:hypothetical protein